MNVINSTSIVDHRGCCRATTNGTFALWIMLSLSSLCVGELSAQDAKVEYASKTVGHKVRVHESLLKDSKRSKELGIRISFPEEQATYPLIIWSHGMYGSKDNYQPLVEYWTSRGYAYHNFGGISSSPPLLNRLIDGQGGGKNDVHLKLVQLSTLVFWDAFLKDDQEALAYLSENKLSDYGQSQLKLESK